MNERSSAPRRTLSRIIPLKLTCLAILSVLSLAANAAAQSAQPDVNGGGGGGGSWVAPVVRFYGLVFNDNGTLRMDCAQAMDGVAE